MNKGDRAVVISEVISFDESVPVGTVGAIEDVNSDHYWPYLVDFGTEGLYWCGYNEIAPATGGSQSGDQS